MNIKGLTVQELEDCLFETMKERAKLDNKIIDICHEVQRRGLTLEWNDSELDRKYYHIKEVEK